MTVSFSLNEPMRYSWPPSVAAVCKVIMDYNQVLSGPVAGGGQYVKPTVEAAVCSTE